MIQDNRRGKFVPLSALLFFYFVCMIVSWFLNGSIGADVLSTMNGQWRNDAAYPLLADAYRQLLFFIIAGAVLALAVLILSIMDYRQTSHESSLCMIIAACLMMVINFIPAVYILVFDHVIALNYYNVLMYTGPFSIQKLYPLYAVLAFIGIIWLFRAVYRFKKPAEAAAQ